MRLRPPQQRRLIIPLLLLPRDIVVQFPELAASALELVEPRRPKRLRRGRGHFFFGLRTPGPPGLLARFRAARFALREETAEEGFHGGEAGADDAEIGFGGGPDGDDAQGPLVWVSHVSDVGGNLVWREGGIRRLAGLTGSVHVGVCDQLYETDETDDTCPRQC